MIEARNLTVKYQTSPKPAVDSVSFQIGGGEFVLLSGASASGKSTAMQAVCGFVPHIIPAELYGSIIIDGKSSLEPPEIAGIIGMVQQDPESQFCTETVEDEIAFGPENMCFPQNAIEEAVEDSLSQVNAAHLRNREIATLSGGEKQKIAIASMLALKPRFLILDEPTSSLDPKSISEVLSAISALRTKLPQLTVMVVEHRAERFLGMATRLICMEQGRITVDTIVGNPDFEAAKNVITDSKWHPKTNSFSKDKIILAVENLSYHAGGKHILQGISFNVFEGGIFALMGENGAGKTTLLRHIACLEKVQEGNIKIFDKTISEKEQVGPSEIGKDVGLVFQNPNHQIFERTVEEEILFAAKNFQTNINDAHKDADIFTSTEGISKTLNPYCLSFGQKRRLNLISASVHGPKLILLDEPFAGQDTDNAKKISNLISTLAGQGKTFIIVTHDIDFASSFCTDIIVLNKGRLVATGNPNEISEKDVFGGGT